MRNLFANLCLLLVSCVLGLSLCEISLRLFYPKYRHLAEAPARPEAKRIWANIPDNRSWNAHPDTHVVHALHHNNLGLRQHRNFSAADLASATNIGVFGDSWTENRRMAAPYSFTEPLDYLLNRSGQRFNVLNFGVEGYGTGQSFLHYTDFRYAQDLDYVVYVYCDNDLGDLYRRGLFDLDDAGHLVENRPLPSSGWVRLISRLHLSYLLLGGSDWLSAGEPYESQKRGRRLAVFRQLLRRWKYLVESSGSSFRVTPLPGSQISARIAAILSEEDIEVIDLYDCYTRFDDAHSQRERRHRPYGFKNDGHWNEAGNHVAAGCLYRALEKELGLPVQTEEELEAALLRYYAAFGGWLPTNAGGGGDEVHSSTATAGIREKYEAFGELTLVKKSLEELTVGLGKRVIASDFDVYFDGEHLTYVKKDCRLSDSLRKIFLYVTPVEGDKILRDRIFDRVSLHAGFMRTGENWCVGTTRLNYPAVHISTGQFIPGKEFFWHDEILIDQGAFRERLERVLAPEKRVLRSDFDVYVDGTRIFYVTDACHLADGQTPFFLHVTPVDETALSADRIEYGFNNHDFYHVGDTLDAHRCVVRWHLPSYAIRHIRTGQFVPGEGGRLWEGEFSMN